MGRKKKKDNLGIGLWLAILHCLGESWAFFSLLHTVNATLIIIILFSCW